MSEVAYVVSLFTLTIIYMQMSAKEFREQLKSGKIVVGKKGRLIQKEDMIQHKGNNMPRQENKLRGKHAVRQSPERKKALDKGFRSNLEKRVSDALTTHGIKHVYEGEKIPYSIKPTLNCACLECGGTDIVENHEYLVDFTVGKVIIEVKGLLVPKDRKKLEAVRKSTDRRIIIMFQKPDTDLYNKSKKEIEARKKSKNPRRTYAGWATANGFEVATIKSIIYVLKGIAI